jgi:hypothetical protein
VRTRHKGQFDNTLVEDSTVPQSTVYSSRSLPCMFRVRSKSAAETQNFVCILSSISRVSVKTRELVDAVQFKSRVFFGNTEFGFHTIIQIICF